MPEFRNNVVSLNIRKIFVNSIVTACSIVQLETWSRLLEKIVFTIMECTADCSIVELFVSAMLTTFWCILLAYIAIRGIQYCTVRVEDEPRIVLTKRASNTAITRTSVNLPSLRAKK